MATRGMLVFTCAVCLVAVACAADERVSVGDAASTTTSSTSTPPTSLSTTSAPPASTSTAPAPTPTAPTERGPVPCDVEPSESGPLLQFGVVPQGVGAPPTGWDQDQQAFDWNQDGQSDDLVLADEAVSVVWDGGSLTISDVRVDFSDEPETEVTPAAVADVTGDGRPDLLLAHNGEVAVVVGAGNESATSDAAFADIGDTVNGWTSPPVEITPPGEDPTLEPLASATVIPLWDVTGDGINDYAANSVIRRANGRFFVYAGKPCS